MRVDQAKSNVETIGNYDLLEKIAEGGMGTVYKGRSHLTGETVAVKVVPQHLLTNPVVVKRFEQEYNAAKLIDHPNIVKALDFGREGGTRFLVMEFVEGESLGQRIEREGRMSEEEAIHIIKQVANGLAKAHQQGLIHRDVKPDNVLLTNGGEVKLTDLGLVKELEADLNLTRTGRGLGTPHFMAPEQFRNAKKADARCDIYSLGATLYMMVTGELPFQSNGPLDAWMKKINNEIEDPRKLVPTLSERMDWAIRRSMSPEAAQRPENCREFIEDLTGQCTQRITNTDLDVPALNDVWYMVYTGDDDVVRTVKGTTNGIRRSLKDGVLGDASNIKIARSKAGPFDAVRAFPEFRDLVVQPSNTVKVNPDTKTPKPAVVKTTSKNAALPNAPRPPAAEGETASDVLTTTNIFAKPPAPFESGPQIHMGGGHTTGPAETWKWIVLALLFCGIGVLATFALPMLRNMRWF